MLMAAGLGTRLRPFTDLTPKPLLPLMGIPMATFAMEALGRAGVRRVVANAHHLGERVIRELPLAAEWHFIRRRLAAATRPSATSQVAAPGACEPAVATAQPDP